MVASIRRSSGRVFLCLSGRQSDPPGAIERACDRECAFDVIVVHSYSRFFREPFEQEFYLRKVRVVSITQPVGVGDENEPVHAMMRKIIAPFDEYQSRECEARHPVDEGERTTGVLEWRRERFWRVTLEPNRVRR